MKPFLKKASFKNTVSRSDHKHGKRKKRQSEFKVFKSVVNNFKRRLCQRIELPDEVKLLFRSPKDETDWDVLEKFRQVVLLFVQGLRCSTLDTED